MPTLEPDDSLRMMIEGLDVAVDHPTVVIKDLNNKDLVCLYTKIQLDLMKRKELTQALTEEGKELHSQHGACLVELKRRNLR